MLSAAASKASAFQGTTRAQAILTSTWVGKCTLLYFRLCRSACSVIPRMWSAAAADSCLWHVMWQALVESIYTMPL